MVVLFYLLNRYNSSVPYPYMVSDSILSVYDYLLFLYLDSVTFDRVPVLGAFKQHCSDSATNIVSESTVMQSSYFLVHLLISLLQFFKIIIEFI